MPFEAISSSAIHNLNTVECSQDEQGSSYPYPDRHQHSRHVASLNIEGERQVSGCYTDAWIPSSLSLLHSSRFVDALYPSVSYVII